MCRQHVSGGVAKTEVIIKGVSRESESLGGKGEENKDGDNDREEEGKDL